VGELGPLTATLTGLSCMIGMRDHLACKELTTSKLARMVKVDAGFMFNG
jgi:hypothetical protein